MSIPLVQNNEKDSINTSIIAIKRNIERINMLLGLSNSEEIDTSKFATKEELQQAVTDLQPVNEVAVDNMHSVTSNAVKQTVTPIAEVASVSMYPRHKAIGRTTSEFLNMIADQDNQTSPACCGSENITDGPWGNAWYNYLYIPHRTGIGGGDNYKFGTLVVFGMTVNTGSIAIKHLINGVWQGWIIN